MEFIFFLNYKHTNFHTFTWNAKMKEQNAACDKTWVLVQKMCKSKICPSSLCLCKKFKINLGSVLLHSTSDYELFVKKGYTSSISPKISEWSRCYMLHMVLKTDNSGIKYPICAQWVIAICCYHVHPPVVKTRDDIEIFCL